MKKSAQRASFIRRLSRKLRRGLDAAGCAGEQQMEEVNELTADDSPVLFDTWDHMHAGSECWSCHDPSSLARRVSLIR